MRSIAPRLLAIFAGLLFVAPASARDRASCAQALRSLGYSPTEASRMVRLGPQFASAVIARAEPARCYYRGLMVAPQLYQFDRLAVNFTPALNVAKRYSGGGLFDERLRGQYAYLVMEYKLPPALVGHDSRHHAHFVRGQHWQDERAVISRVGVVLKQPGVTSEQSPMAFLDYKEAFRPDGVMKTAAELQALARARLVAGPR